MVDCPVACPSAALLDASALGCLWLWCSSVGAILTAFAGLHQGHLLARRLVRVQLQGAMSAILPRPHCEASDSMPTVVSSSRATLQVLPPRTLRDHGLSGVFILCLSCPSFSDPNPPYLTLFASEAFSSHSLFQSRFSSLLQKC